VVLLEFEIAQHEELVARYGIANRQRHRPVDGRATCAKGSDSRHRGQKESRSRKRGAGAARLSDRARSSRRTQPAGSACNVPLVDLAVAASRSSRRSRIASFGLPIVRRSWPAETARGGPADFGDAREARLELGHFGNEVVRLNPTFFERRARPPQSEFGRRPARCRPRCSPSTVCRARTKTDASGQAARPSGARLVRPSLRARREAGSQTMGQEDRERHHALGRLGDEEFAHAGDAAGLEYRERPDRANPPAQKGMTHFPGPAVSDRREKKNKSRHPRGGWSHGRRRRRLSPDGQVDHGRAAVSRPASPEMDCAGLEEGIRIVPELKNRRRPQCRKPARLLPAPVATISLR